jgi:two-component system nitrate/nitrite response regulator NarL
MSSNAARDATSVDAMPIRVAVVGGHALTRDSLRALLAQHADAHALSDAQTDESGEDAEEPDVVVLDVDGADGDAMSMLHEARTRWPDAHVIVLTASREPEHAEQVVLAGASGVLTKDRPGEHLALAIRKVHAGEVWLGRGPMAHLISELAWHPRGVRSETEHNPIASLTVREREVIGLVSVGLSNKAIASSLCISENTVRHHLTSVFGKLGVPDRLSLAVYAFHHQLANDQPG